MLTRFPDSLLLFEFFIMWVATSVQNTVPHPAFLSTGLIESTKQWVYAPPHFVLRGDRVWLSSDLQIEVVTIEVPLSRLPFLSPLLVARGYVWIHRKSRHGNLRETCCCHRSHFHAPGALLSSAKWVFVELAFSPASHNVYTYYVHGRSWAPNAWLYMYSCLVSLDISFSRPGSPCERCSSLKRPFFSWVQGLVALRRFRTDIIPIRYALFPFLSQLP